MVELSAYDSQNWATLLTTVSDSCSVGEQPSLSADRLRQLQRHLDQDGQARVVAAYQQGKTIDDVARQFGLHRTTVRAILDRARVTVRPREMSAAQVNLAIRLYADGLSLQQVGERLGFNAQTIANQLQDRGVPRRVC